jgi:N-acetylated-alpha-linked acidic dipeptidase
MRQRLMFSILAMLITTGVVVGQDVRSQQKISKADEWAMRYRSIPEPHNMREYLRTLSARPHHPGSAYGRELAGWIESQLRSWGWDTRIEKYDVLLPVPKERLLEMMEPTRFTAKLQEPPVLVDPTSAQQDEQLPTYNAYSIDGDVTAPVVYVNYGLPSDYDQLDRMGITVKGAIVLVRYGASWRGIKPKVAAEHGAVGCLIYSDPKGDGYFQGETFPDGPWRPEDGVQRGSVMDIPIRPGDPLTPNEGAVSGARRLPLEKVEVLTKIPVLPISYADAKALLAALGGPVAPDNWRGAYGITYHIGPGPTKVHMKIASQWTMRTLHNVIARIKGSEFPDEWIIRGNHHDAWVNGAEDPGSGQMCLLEEARSLGQLVKEGWKPKRTLVYCAWDGEEQGLLGSTEWAEAHADELQKCAALYINSDSNGRGFLSAGGSHSLEKFMNTVSREIEDPETKLTVWKRSHFRLLLNTPAIDRAKVRGYQDLPLGALGSGSDYTPFLDHLGIASLNLGFGGEDGGGIYHSIYDDFYWYTHFSDTSFVYGRALAQTVGTAIIKFADADVLPYDFTGLAETLRKYVDEIKLLHDTKRKEIIEQNQLILDGAFTANADPQERYVPPVAEPVPPFLNFAPLDNAIDSLARVAARYQKALAKLQTLARPIPAGVNTQLIQSERKLLLAGGLPGRPWYRHQVYAPGLYTGYGVKTIPAVREAIEQKQWQDVDGHIARVGSLLLGLAGHVESIARALEEAGK